MTDGFGAVTVVGTRPGSHAGEFCDFAGACKSEKSPKFGFGVPCPEPRPICVLLLPLPLLLYL